MRIWSVHPKFLDSKGLVALWRETLLAQKVLQGRTKGYKNHPQLHRFKKQHSPLTYICAYLHSVCDDADSSGYKFDRTKIILSRDNSLLPIPVTTGQVRYEWQHLLRKLRVRAPELFSRYENMIDRDLHPLFQITTGEIEDWEIVLKK
jgi:Pyrimidine dimer DNA glycosylase